MPIRVVGWWFQLFLRSGTGKIHCNYFKDVAAKRLVCWDFCSVQTNVLRFSTGGQDCIGSTKLALISSYSNQVAPTYIHPNMSLQIEGRWGNCHVLVGRSWVEVSCLPRSPQWWILSSLVTRPSLRNRTLATREVGIEKHTVNPSWCWTPRKAPRKDVGFSHRHLLKRIVWRYWDREQGTEILHFFGISNNVLTNGGDP